MAAAQELRRRLQEFHDCLEPLRILVELDQPAQNRFHLPEYFEQEIALVRAWFDEAWQAVREPAQASFEQICICQDRMLRIGHKLVCELESPERLGDLMDGARERGREWREWAAGLRSALIRCREPVWRAQAALFECWQEKGRKIDDK